MGFTLVPTVTLSVLCTKCREITKFSLDREGFMKWKGGICIQEALPDVSPDIRELMISGVCGTCFDKLFSEGSQDARNENENKGKEGIGS